MKTTTTMTGALKKMTAEYATRTPSAQALERRMTAMFAMRMHRACNPSPLRICSVHTSVSRVARPCNIAFSGSPPILWSAWYGPYNSQRSAKTDLEACRLTSL